jgi:hypothetical protein
MTTDQFLDFFKQKSFSTGIPLFLSFVFVNLDGTFLCSLALTVHNTQHTSSGIPIAVECYVIVTGSSEEGETSLVPEVKLPRH